MSCAPSPGFVRQLADERACAQQNKLSFETVLFTTARCEEPFIRNVTSIGVRLIDYLHLRLTFYLWLVRSCKHYRNILLRYSVHDPLQLVALLFIRKIWTVHHTLEREELAIGSGPSAFCKRLVEKALRQPALRLAAGHVAVTGEIAESLRDSTRGNQRILVYPNGIRFAARARLPDRRSGSPTLCFLASHFTPWQGLDCLARVLNETDWKVRIDIIGRVEEPVLAQLHRDSRFRLHGTLKGAELEDVLAEAWYAFAPLALHRKSMKEACSLKVREYLELGIPVFGTSRDAGLPSTFSYYRLAELTVENLKTYAQEVRKAKRHDVRAVAQEYLDKEHLMAALIAGLNAPQSRVSGAAR